MPQLVPFFFINQVDFALLLYNIIVRTIALFIILSCIISILLFITANMSLPLSLTNFTQWIGSRARVSDSTPIPVLLAAGPVGRGHCLYDHFDGYNGGVLRWIAYTGTRFHEAELANGDRVVGKLVSDRNGVSITVYNIRINSNNIAVTMTEVPGYVTSIQRNATTTKYSYNKIV